MTADQDASRTEDVGTLLLTLLAKQAAFGASLIDVHVALNQVMEAVTRIEKKLDSAAWTGQERRRPMS